MSSLIKSKYSHIINMVSVSKLEMHCLVNADVFLLVSNQRTYFFDQRRHYLSEIERLTELYIKYQRKKQEWKDKYLFMTDMNNKTITRLETEIIQLRQITYCPKESIGSQTDIDYKKYNEIQRQFDNATIYKQMVIII